MGKCKEEIDKIIKDNIQVLTNLSSSTRLPTLDTFLAMEYGTDTLDRLDKVAHSDYKVLTQQFLFEAVARADLTNLDNLVNNYKIDPKTIKDVVGKNALHHAAAKNNLSIVKYLLDSNIDPTIKDENGRKAVDYTKDIHVAHLLGYHEGCTEGYTEGYNAGQDSLLES